MRRQALAEIQIPKLPFGVRVVKDFKKHWPIYCIALLCLTWYFIFCYAPMGGIVIAFKNFRPTRGIWRSDWVGLKWFKQFFGSYYFTRLLRNTLTINLLSLIVGHSLSIGLALLLNEVRHSGYKRTVQTVTYMPHFVSTVVACSLVLDLFAPRGLVNQIITQLGGEQVLFFTKPDYFPWIYVGTQAWQGTGYNSIVYLAALASVDMELFDAAAIDGCNRFKRVLHVTLPGIMPTIMLMMLLKIGSMLSVGYERIILLYNDAVMERADVFSSFVYRYGLVSGNYSYSTAADMFNSIANLLLLISFNAISRKVSEISLW